MDLSLLLYNGNTYTIRDIVMAGMANQKKYMVDISTSKRIPIVRSFSEPREPFQVVFFNKNMVDFSPFESYYYFNADPNVKMFKNISLQGVLDSNDIAYLGLTSPDDLAAVIFPHIGGIIHGKIGDDYTSLIFRPNAKQLFDNKIRFGPSGGVKKSRKSKLQIIK